MKSMRNAKYLTASVVTVILAMAVPGMALACLPPLPVTAAQDLADQADMWARYDMVFAVRVSAVEPEGQAAEASDGPPRLTRPGEGRLRVQLTPVVMVKGDQPLPEPYEKRNIFIGCAPQGLQRAEVGQRYLIYRSSSQNSGTDSGIVEIDRLKDPETLLAVYQAATLAALEL